MIVDQALQSFVVVIFQMLLPLGFMKYVSENMSLTWTKFHLSSIAINHSSTFCFSYGRAILSKQSKKQVLLMWKPNKWLCRVIKHITFWQPPIIDTYSFYSESFEYIHPSKPLVLRSKVQGDTCKSSTGKRHMCQLSYVCIWLFLVTSGPGSWCSWHRRWLFG